MNQQVNQQVKQHHSKAEKQLGIIPQDGFMRLHPVLSVIPVSKTAWYEGISRGVYPAPVKLSERTSAWKVADIRKLIEELGGKV